MMRRIIRGSLKEMGCNDLEDSLVKPLVQVVPADQRERVDPSILNGPVVSLEGRSDVVADQREVDDLLASLGF